MNFKKNGGFTLVELIVVIAILAILGGVAVPAYSGYVEKANMGADISLAGEIKQALVLAHYAGTIKPGASVTVYYGDADVVADGEGTDAAMKAVFGEGYADTLRLSYGEWDMGPAGDPTVMNNVNNSNFKRDQMGSLLTQVQTVVDAFSDYVADGNFTVDTNSEAYKYLQMGGYNGGAITSENAQAVGNAMVFGVSEQIGNALNTEESKQQFVELWNDGADFSSIAGMDAVAQMAAKYAYTLALAKEADKLTGGTTYSDMLTAGVNAEGADNKTLIINNMKLVEEKIAEDADTNTALSSGMEAYYNGTGTGTTPIQTDALSFLAYMNGVTTSSGSILEGTDLSKNNFFSDGNVLNYVDNYFDASDILQGAPDGAIVFIYNGTDVIFCTPDPMHN